METVAEWTMGAWVRALARQDPVPAGGALALATLAGAAALAAKAARLGGGPTERWEARAKDFLREADRDGALYLQAVRMGEEGVRACLEAGLEALEKAVGALEDLGDLFAGLSPALAADVAAAERLARAGAQTLSLNLAANLSAWAGCDAGLAGFAPRWAGLRARLEAA